MHTLTDPLGRPIHLPDVDEVPTDILDRFARTDIVAYDVETTGTERTDILRTVQLGTPDEELTLRADSPLHMDALRTWFATSTATLTAHNAVFDIGVLHRAGIADMDALWSRTVDTMLLDQLLRPGDGAVGVTHGLKQATAEWCGDQATAADAKAELFAWGRTLGLKTNAATFRDCPIDGEPYLRYGAADVYDGSALVRVLLPLADAAIGRDVVEREHRTAALIHRACERGMRVDSDAVATDLPTAQARVEAARQALIDHYGIGNPASNPQLRAWFAERGMVLHSTSEETLQGLVLDGELAAFRDELLAWRELSKVLSTYLRSLSAVPRDEDGVQRFHPDLRTLGARTGRMACGKPSMQNYPGAIRRYVIPEPGHTLVGADYNAVEVRIAAGNAADRRLTAAFLNGVDCYEVTSEVLWGAAPPTGTPEYKQFRNAGKVPLLGHIYSRGANSLARGVGVSREVAKTYQESLDAGMPEIPVYGAQCRAEVSSGLTAHRLPSGRVVQTHPLGYFTTSVNTRVQGAGRDLIVDAMLRLDYAGWGNVLWLTIHDEWIIQVPDALVEDAVVALNAAMTGAVGAVPIIAQAEVMGKEWKKL